MAAIEILNLKALLYLAFRLAPFILVSYFVVSSIFNADVRGIIFLGMLLINCFITIVVGNFFADIPGMMVSQNTRNRFGTCNTMNLTSGGPLSKALPLNINVFAFTFGYLAQLLERDPKLVNRNIPMILVFCILIITQLVWSITNGCATFMGLIISLSIGFGLGWGFSAIIVKSGITDLQFFNGIKNEEVCSKPTDEIFNCTVENVL